MTYYASISTRYIYDFFTSELTFCENVNFCVACKMDTDYDNMTIVELRALARAQGLRDCTVLRKIGLIAFLRDNAMPERPVRPSNVHYEELRIVELMALAREHGLWYSRLRKAGLIALLQENEPMLEPSVGTNSEPRSAARPLRPTRPPSPPSEDSFVSYELEQAFRGTHPSFQINGKK